MHQKLEIYLSEVELTALIAIVVCHGEVSIPLGYVKGGRELLPDLEDVVSGLMITKAWARHRRDYWDLLQQVLVPLTSEGPYTLDGESYAKASLHLLERMYNADTREYLIYDGLYFLEKLLDQASLLKELTESIAFHQSFVSQSAKSLQESSTTAGYYSMNPMSRSQHDYKKIILVDMAQGIRRYMERIPQPQKTTNPRLKRKRSRKK